MCRVNYSMSKRKRDQKPRCATIKIQLMEWVWGMNKSGIFVSAEIIMEKWKRLLIAYNSRFSETEHVFMHFSKRLWCSLQCDSTHSRSQSLDECSITCFKRRFNRRKIGRALDIGLENEFNRMYQIH